MKKITSVFLILILIFPTSFSSFAEVQSGGRSDYISNATEDFMYGSWQIKSFYGFHDITKYDPDEEHPFCEKLVGKEITITADLFDSESVKIHDEFYKSNAVKAENVKYTVDCTFSGEDSAIELYSMYKINYKLIKITAGDEVQIISVRYAENNDFIPDLSLLVVNNNRLLINLTDGYFELERIPSVIDSAGGGKTDKIVENAWIEHNLNFSILPPELMEDEKYHILYNDIDTEQIALTERILLLMVNGGMVSNPQMKIINGSTLIRAETISQYLDATVNYSQKDQTVQIKSGDKNINLKINSLDAFVDDVQQKLLVEPIVIDGEIFVPLRFVAESLSAKVDYIHDLVEIGGYKFESDEPAITIITIEKEEGKDIYTAEQGLACIIEAYKQTHDMVIEFLRESEGTFEQRHKDFDPLSVTYIEQTVGCYYVYKMDDFPFFTVFFNKHTGEIFSCKTGTVTYAVSKGFVNLLLFFQ